ncbi:TetR/AcrR family transcriptional regulator [Prescottella agglutinans]|uniref:TetR/AcrR family transcriptional regulator n=1 Tax=Prescottella agglutinans TaxID=1644129 RepID=A0A438BGD0_9NOCA|nr:TetR/AcrR family transcriptional regulator [Prescottella agglutinans]
MLRGQIMAASAKLFYERGYAATSIRDIAEAVDISSSTMYHHFKNKQEVLHAIVTQFMTDFVAEMDEILRDKTLAPTDRIRQTVRKHIEFSDDRRPELLVGNPIRNALDADQQREGIRLQSAYHDAVRDTIKDGVDSGEFDVPDVAVATMAVLDMLNGVREWFTPRGTLTRDALVERYVCLVLRLLGADR